ncbi:hypothetical protein C8Q75DRAFT_722932, partial [Abortiporus biennis]
FVIFVLGLFYLKMAYTDAIWYIFIELKDAQRDLNYLLEYVSQLHPKETEKIESKSGFCHMYKVI